MLYIIAIVLMVIGLKFKSDRKITALFFIFLLLLFGWSYGNADYQIHLRKFTEFQTQSWQTEPIYSLLMRLFNFFGLNYRVFLICFGFFTLYTYFTFIKKFTIYTNFVLIMYIIFPLCMDVTIVRYTLSMVVVYWGFYYLFQNEKGALIKYVLIVLFAALIHLSSALALLFILPKLFNRKRLVSVVSIGVIVFSLLGSAVLRFFEKITTISFMNIGAKIRIILTSAKMRYDISDYINYGLKILIIFGLFTFVYASIVSWYRKNYVPEIDSNIKMLNIIYNMNISMLLIIPLIIFSADVFRIQLSLSLINYVGIAQFFEMKRKIGNVTRRGVTTSYTLFVLFGTILYAFSGLYLWVLSSSNINSVFKALYENNILVQ